MCVGGGGGGDISVHEIFSYVVTLKIEIVKMSKCTSKCTTKEDHNTLADGNGLDDKTGMKLRDHMGKSTELI